VRARLARSDDEWHALLARHGGSAFQSLRWLTAVVPALGQHLVPLVLDDADVLRAPDEAAAIGILPLVLRRSGLPAANLLPFPDVGPLVAPDRSATVLAYVREVERRSRILRSSYCVNATAPTAQAAPQPWIAAGAEHGYSATSRVAWVVDLDPDVAELRRRLAGGRRAQLRRADRAGIRVRPASRTEVAYLLPRWTAHTFARQGGRSPYPPEVFEAVASAYADGPARLAAACTPQGEPLAVMATIGGAPLASGWTVQRRPGAPASDAVAALYWDSVVWAKAMGHTALDLGGGTTTGVANYQRGWGAQPWTRVRLSRSSGLAALASGLRERLAG
jgi:CelD/BcsL family acetyltransferase involved in cellulose biosynthesis